MGDTKTEIISGKITKLRGDTKNLYSLVYQLTGNVKENPLPERESDEDLANEFTDYFMNKIQTICGSLEECEKFHPLLNNDTDILAQFKPMSEEEVREILNSMQKKATNKMQYPKNPEINPRWSTPNPDQNYQCHCSNKVCLQRLGKSL